MSVKKRILKNGFAALFQKGTKIAEQLLLVPFFIKYWGAAYYGEWLTLTIVPATLALADLGFGSATANSFLLKYASGDKQGAANIAKTGIYILNFLVVGAILLTCISIFCLNYWGVFEKSLIPSSDAISAVLILMLARIFNFYGTLFEAYFRAARKANISINYQTFIAMSNIIVGLIILLAGGHAKQYAWGSLLVVLVLNPLYIFIARKVLGLNKEYKGTIDKSLIKPLIKKGIGYFLSPIWQAVYYQGMTFVVRITLGSVAVTIFNTVRTLVRSSAQAFGMAITAVYPDFQFEMGARNFEKARKIFLGVLLTNLIMAIGFIIGLLLFGEPLYQWWTKNALDVPQNIWVVFIIGIFFYALWFTLSFIFEALNRPYIITVAGFICSIVVVAGFWCLADKLGLFGAAINCLIFDILMCMWLLYSVMYFKRNLQLQSEKFS